MNRLPIPQKWVFLEREHENTSMPVFPFSSLTIVVAHKGLSRKRHSFFNFPPNHCLVLLEWTPDTDMAWVESLEKVWIMKKIFPEPIEMHNLFDHHVLLSEYGELVPSKANVLQWRKTEHDTNLQFFLLSKRK
jgi:hypothetical protein